MKIAVVLLILVTACRDKVLRPIENMEGHYKDLRAKKELNVLVFGDWGKGNEEQKSVAQAMKSVCSQKACDLAFLLGDNFYGSGVSSVNDIQWKTKFEDIYGTWSNFEFWAVLGNHDWGGNAQAQIDYTLLSTHWRMPAQVYEILGLPAWLHIVGTDTQQIRLNKPNALQTDLIRKKYCNQKGWNILMGHHPIYSHGNHGADPDTREAFVPLIKDCKFQFYFAGHDHHQEYIDKGLFHTVIQGAAASHREISTPADGQLFGSIELGFSILKIQESQLTTAFYNEQGKLLWEKTVTPSQFGGEVTLENEAIGVDTVK